MSWTEPLEAPEASSISHALTQGGAVAGKLGDTIRAKGAVDALRPIGEEAGFVQWRSSVSGSSA